ncbi:peptide-methionine (S)-S-oxide reductase MsrA [Candidatus Woesebacteria bacterium]|nr:MAG: peptide-methionine (S)-S-oxide reductase MsrA [Candidatus Woesebacteria bacterium]
MKATFALGCFWHPDEIFSKLPGVTNVIVGYAGGSQENPTYDMVCSGKTGHVEAIEVFYDPEVISYEKLLDTFWSSHDPTQTNGQGVDIGTQYKSVIFYHDDKQKLLAETSKFSQAKLHNKEIATQIIQTPKFYQAEEYHQKYLLKKRNK